MKTKLLLLLLSAFSMVNAQITWDFKTGVEGWGAYGGDIAPSWDNSDNLVCNYQIAGNYPAIYNDQPLNVANVNYFYMKFTATNWPKTSVLVNIQFEMGGNNYYANQTMNVASGEFQFNIRTEVQHAWSILPATGTPSRIRIEIPHNSELAGSNWSTASLKIDKIAFTSSLTTGLSNELKSDITTYFNKQSNSLILQGADNCPVKIYDVAGKLLKSVNNYSTPINTRNIKNGIYILKIFSDKQTITRKININ
jgi:hypothetical protein